MKLSFGKKRWGLLSSSARL